MALAYLIDPEIQFSDKSGMLNVAGFLRVYLNGTDDRAVTYKDFNGTLNEADIILDNNGRAVVVADSSKAYRLEVYNREGALLWTTYPLETLKGGGGGTAGFNVVSSDGTVEVNRYSEGGITNFDLSVNYDFDQSNVLVAASGALVADGDFQFTSDPITSDGERIYLEYGQIRAKAGWYHFDASVEITWPGTPANREAAVAVTGPYEAERVMFDLSYAHKECLTIAGDLDIGTDGTPITFAIQGMPTGMSATVVNASVHALVAGSAGGGTGPSYQPGTGIVIENNTISVDQSTVAMQSDLPDMSGYQEKLTTGDGISIDGNNEISVKTDGTSITVNADGELVATGGSFTQIQADYAQTNDQAVDYIKNKPDLSVFAQSADLATVATSGDYDDLINKPSIPAAQVNSDWNAVSGVSQILNKPSLAAVATSGDYNDLTNTPVIPPGVTVDQVYDPTSTNAQSGTAVAGAISGKQDTISDLSDIRSGAAAGATAVQPGDLATVATTGDYDDLLNKPTIPAAQVNSDWNAVSGVAQILNKPSLSAVATSGDYNDLTNKPSIPAAQVNSDWNASSGVSQILNKPSLATVATSGDYNDLSNTPTINNVPAVTSADDDKVLKASYSGGAGSYSWENDTSDVPAYTTSDDGKVLGVVDNQGTAELQWITGGTGTQVQSDWTENDSTDPAYIKHRPVEQLLSAGSGISIAESSGTVVISSNVSMSSLNTAGITDLQVVQSLPASTTATVLYLIPET